MNLKKFKTPHFDCKEFSYICGVKSYSHEQNSNSIIGPSL